MNLVHAIRAKIATIARTPPVYAHSIATAATGMKADSVISTAFAYSHAVLLIDEFRWPAAKASMG